MDEQVSRKKVSVFKIICIALALIIALYCLAYLVAIIVTGDSFPMPLGFGSAVVLSGSMEPTLSVNDLIFVVRSDEYEVGDIVVYSTRGTPVVHRVVQLDMQNGAVITRGDHNNTNDDPISLEHIKGKMLFSVPYVGAIPRFIRTVPGLLIVLLVLFALLFVSVRGKAAESEESDKAEELMHEIERLKQELGENGGENDRDQTE